MEPFTPSSAARLKRTTKTPRPSRVPWHDAWPPCAVDARVESDGVVEPSGMRMDCGGRRSDNKLESPSDTLTPPLLFALLEPRQSRTLPGPPNLIELPTWHRHGCAGQSHDSVTHVMMWLSHPLCKPDTSRLTIDPEQRQRPAPASSRHLGQHPAYSKTCLP